MQQYQCQVCDYKNKKVGYEEWFLVGIDWPASEDWPQGQYQILICQKCNVKLAPHEVLEGYKRRIREGRDANFH